MENGTKASAFVVKVKNMEATVINDLSCPKTPFIKIEDMDHPLTNAERIKLLAEEE